MSNMELQSLINWDKLIIIPRFVRKIRIYFTSSNLFPSHRETRNCARKASYLGKSFDFTSGGFFISLGRRYSTLFRSNTELNGTSLKVIAMGIDGWSIKRSQVKGWRGRNERYRGIQSGKSRVTTACARLKGCFRPDLWSLKSRPMFFSSSSSSSPFFFGGCHIRDASFFVTRPTKELIEGNFFSIRCIRLEEVAEYFYIDASSCFHSKRCRLCSIRSEDERRNTQLADFVIIDINTILIINVWKRYIDE